MIRKFTTLLFISLIINLNIYSQAPKSQRMVLSEEFTQSGSGVCASLNPAYDSLLQVNNTKVVSISYHINIPGSDPMNLQNPNQVATRASYYGISNTIPYVFCDGNIYSGGPQGFTQTILNNAYAVSSPFTLTLSHNLSTNKDSVYVKCVINCTSNAVFTGPLKAYIVMTEDSINFATAPGSNGEKVFYNVMRKMFPTDAGQSLALNWTVGDKDSILISTPIPSYIYDVNKMAFVAFIQDNSTKNVKQAAYLSPLPISSSSTITALNNVPAFQCSTNPFTPSLSLKNTSTTDTLHTATIIYVVDSGAVQSYIWNGTLAPGTTTNVTLPAITPTSGLHQLSVYTMPFAGMNFTKTAKYIIESNYTTTPLNQDFEGTFPPTNYIIDSPSKFNWELANVSAFGSGSQSVVFSCYGIDVGNIAYLYSAPMNLSSLSIVKMAFAMAHCQFQSENDQLEVQVSTDCGSSWNSLYTKSGSALATAPSSNNAFVPTSSQWRNELVNLATVAGQSKVLIRFKATSAYGNNIYIDNVYIATDAGISELDQNNNVSISPNPFNSSTTISFALSESNNVTLKVINVLGKKVFETNKSKLDAGNHTIELNGSNLSNGIYFVNITIGDRTITKKVVRQ